MLMSANEPKFRKKAERMVDTRFFLSLPKTCSFPWPLCLIFVFLLSVSIISVRNGCKKTHRTTTDPKFIFRFFFRLVCVCVVPFFACTATFFLFVNPSNSFGWPVKFLRFVCEAIFSAPGVMLCMCILSRFLLQKMTFVSLGPSFVPRVYATVVVCCVSCSHSKIPLSIHLYHIAMAFN